MVIKKSLSKANVLAKVSQFDIFNSYCTPFKKLYEPFKSELRLDKNPTCSICRVGENLVYSDFAEFGTKDCFNYLQDKYQISFIQALEMVNRDFNLNLLSSVKLNAEKVTTKKTDYDIMVVPEKVIDIRVCIRNWSLADKEYWYDKFDIKSSTLNKYKIFPLSGFFINGAYTKCGSSVYGYYFGTLPDGREAWKIYQPLNSKEFKWRTNCSDFIIQGWEQLPETGDLLIITKSLKDIVTFDQIKINSIAPQAESHTIIPNVVTSLKKRFKHILILYDNDEPGIKAAKKLAECFDLPFFFMPEGTKDASDFVELYGQESLYNYIKEIYDGIQSNNS